ncbi:MAG: hypothetical protein E7774_08795 [Bradyrhizobium sp.]|nr:MAG: hypothetical protein E7774_08795 [Bradyrhizobium sp.]
MMSAVSSSKYQPLTQHLRTQRANSVTMSFSEIERVLGAKLPPSASSHRAWWSNNPTNNVMTKAWLEAGFHSGQVDLAGRKLVFKRVKAAQQPPSFAENPQSDFVTLRKLGLFGWLRGTVISAGDLTEPADPDWAKRAADE